MNVFLKESMGEKKMWNWFCSCVYPSGSCGINHCVFHGALWFIGVAEFTLVCRCHSPFCLPPAFWGEMSSILRSVWAAVSSSFLPLSAPEPMLHFPSHSVSAKTGHGCTTEHGSPHCIALEPRLQFPFIHLGARKLDGVNRVRLVCLGSDVLPLGQNKVDDLQRANQFVSSLPFLRHLHIFCLTFCQLPLTD